MKKFLTSKILTIVLAGLLVASLVVITVTSVSHSKTNKANEEKIEQLETEKAGLESKKAELEAAKATLETALETANNDKAALETAKAALEAEIEALKANSEVATLKAQIAALEAELEAAQNDKAALEAAKVELETAKAAAEEALEAAEAELEAAKEAAEAAQEAFNAALEDLYDAGNENFSQTLVFANEEEVFAEGVAVVGKSYALQVEYEYAYQPEGAEAPIGTFRLPLGESDEIVYDYFYAGTADYNNGFSFDEEGVTFELFGGYYIAAFLKSDFANYVPFDTDDKAAFQEADNYLAAYNLVAYGVGNGAWTYITADEAVHVGFGETYEAALEAGLEEEHQINVSEGYVLVSATSDAEAVATVSETGLVTTHAEGTATISVVVKAEDGSDERTELVVVKVAEKKAAELTAGGAEGAWFDFKSASVATQTKILAYMERYLIDNGASIPVYNNSGVVLYSERVNFIAENYVAQMGYGATAVPMDGGQTAKGTAEDPAYRMWTSADPSTLNHLNYADSVESDFLSLIAGSMISFDWKVDENGVGIGWEIKPEMLEVLPYPIDENGEKVEEFSGLNAYSTWRFDLRDDLKWANGDVMNVEDFIYTYKLVLDPQLNMKRANYFYGGEAAIAGAKAYFDGETDDWSTVGIKEVEGENSFTFTFANELKLWDVCYNLSGFLHTPVHKATWEANLVDGTPKYGNLSDATSANAEENIAKIQQTYMASGAYQLCYVEKAKEYRFTKNPNYFLWNEEAEDVQVRCPIMENYSYTIVKDSNAALVLFKEGKLDVTSIPATQYDEWISWPNQKFSPGATSFRLSVNRMTQAELDANYGKGAWEAKPILQEDDFMWALYFGLDREGVQKITKTSEAWASYFTNAYVIVTPTEEGVDSVTYRESEWGKAVYSGFTALDTDLLFEQKGYDKEYAKAQYILALQSMMNKGLFESGEAYNVEIEIAAFDGVTNEAVYAYVAKHYNDLFNEAVAGHADFANVTFTATFVPQPGMDVYYVKQMTGQYDLALAGISGGTMAPAGFMECFCDDNRSGLLLSLGLDSHNANILIDLDVDGDGELDGEKYWSFDALYSAMCGKTFVQNGMEAEAPEEAE